jgi:hypothetical protein
MNFTHPYLYSRGKNLERMAENTRYSGMAGVPVISTRSKQPLKTDFNKPMKIIRERNAQSTVDAA